MWLLPLFSLVANLVARIFYRLQVAGPRLARSGPVLLVANHPNGLLDPALVAAASGRRVRFLAKAPLFEDRVLGWMVRGVGSIPVYRRIDDPSQVARNEEMFRAGFEALAQGAVIALFPEGTSHSEPELKRLKTGGARLALGAALEIGTSFPIVPIGLVFRDKERFRSKARVVFGDPIEWQDLASENDRYHLLDSSLRLDVPRPGTSSESDHDAVRELTRRIDRGLRSVTVNVEQWEDEPLLRCAEGIWQSEALSQDPVERVRQLSIATRLLARWRQRPDPDDPTLVMDVHTHGRRLSRLGLTSALLSADTSLWTTLRWTASRVYLLGMPALVLATAGYLVYLVPFHLTDIVARAVAPDKEEQTATYKVLVGTVVYGGWVILLAVLVGFYFGRADLLTGLILGVITAILLPLFGLAGLWVREHWRGTARDLRHFFFVRSRRKLVERLRLRQSQLAERIVRFVQRQGELGQTKLSPKESE